jgi:hypothetical protein
VSALLSFVWIKLQLLIMTIYSDEVMDMLLDQEGLEVDPLDRMEKDTPLHKAVRFVNELPKPQWENGKQFVELLLDAGADPRYVVLIRIF